MMFEPTSRYTHVKTARYTDDSGNSYLYKLRRRIPRTARGAVSEATVGQDERPDIVSALLLGSPTLYWHLCDINDEIDPEAIAVAGRVLKVTPIRNPSQ